MAKYTIIWLFAYFVFIISGDTPLCLSNILFSINTGSDLDISGYQFWVYRFPVKIKYEDVELPFKYKYKQQKGLLAII